MSQMVCHKSTNTISSGRETTRNKPAPSLATSSSSVDVLAEVMASGSFRVKGNTSLVGKTLIEVKEQRGGGQVGVEQAELILYTLAKL